MHGAIRRSISKKIPRNFAGKLKNSRENYVKNKDLFASTEHLKDRFKLRNGRQEPWEKDHGIRGTFSKCESPSSRLKGLVLGECCTNVTQLIPAFPPPPNSSQTPPVALLNQNQNPSIN